MSNFDNDIRKWVKIEEEINNLQIKINKLKKKKTELNPNLINYMNKNKKKKININSSYNLVLGSKTQYSTFNKAYLLDILKKFVNSNLAEQIILNLYDNREKKIIKNLEIKKI